jgi:propanediol dehydratase small subunit
VVFKGLAKGARQRGDHKIAWRFNRLADTVREVDDRILDAFEALWFDATMAESPMERLVYRRLMERFGTEWCPRTATEWYERVIVELTGG